MKPALRHNLLTSSRLAALALTAFGSMPAIAADLPGTVDLIAGGTNGRVGWSLNIGNTAAYGPESYTFGGSVIAGFYDIGDIESGDLDGDGWEDVITASYFSEITACFNTGTATTPFVCTRDATFFDTQGVALPTTTTSTSGWGLSTDATVADFNGDGRDDVTSGQWLCMSNGDRTFECEVLTRMGSSIGAVSEAGDLDSDGDVDLFVASGGESSWFLETCLNQGDTDSNEIPNFTCAKFAQYDGNKLNRGTPFNVELGDYSGDGKLDAYVYTNKVPHTCIGEGDGSFLPAKCLRPNIPAANFIDWDGAGAMELLGGPYTGPSVWSWDNTTSTWSSGSVPCAAGINAWTTPAVRDIDGDGHMEWTQGQHLYKATGYLNGAPQCTEMQHAVLGGSSTPLFINVNEPLGGIVDTDGDGVPDSEDLCAGHDDAVDPDADGVPTGCDFCPADLENDADGDLVCESTDNCEDISNIDQNDEDFDGIGDLCEADTDGDGVIDDFDAFPLDPDYTADSDGDTVPDELDACEGWDDDLDADGDGAPDGDGVGSCDLCPVDAENDADIDGWCESEDNCEDLANEDQTDTDTDGQGDACDGDDDNDGVLDGGDAFPTDAGESIDTDGDGTGNNADEDDDNDGVLDGDDTFPTDGYESTDTDGDGVGDNGDACPLDAADDTDGDTVCDSDDQCAGDDLSGDGDADAVCDNLDTCFGDDNIGDTDLDGTCDDVDTCAVDADKTEPGDCGCGTADADTDTDGITDCLVEDVALSCQRARVHWNNKGTGYAEITGRMELGGGLLAPDFRDGASGDAVGNLSLSVAGTSVYDEDGIVYDVRDSREESDNQEKWEMKESSRESASFRWKNSRRYDARRADDFPNVHDGESSIGWLVSRFIHADETLLRVRWNRHTMMPLTIAVDGVPLLSIEQDDTMSCVESSDAVTGIITTCLEERYRDFIVRSTYDVSTLRQGHGKERNHILDLHYNGDRLGDGNVMAWYQDGDASDGLDNLLYSQEAIDDGSATSVWFNAGGVYDVKVPVTGSAAPTGNASVAMAVRFGGADTTAVVDGEAVCADLIRETTTNRRGVVTQVDWRLREIDEDHDGDDNEDEGLAADDDGGTCGQPEEN